LILASCSALPRTGDPFSDDDDDGGGDSWWRYLGPSSERSMKPVRAAK
jgi:hypothetical protein